MQWKVLDSKLDGCTCCTDCLGVGEKVFGLPAYPCCSRWSSEGSLALATFISFQDNSGNEQGAAPSIKTGSVSHNSMAGYGNQEGRLDEWIDV